MNIAQIITMIVITAIFILFIVLIALSRKRMWESIHNGDTVVCRTPDGKEIVEYVMAYRPEEDRVCLSKEGWVSKFDFLSGKNEYFLVNTD
jgi:hypothetical protein